MQYGGWNQKFKIISWSEIFIILKKNSIYGNWLNSNKICVDFEEESETNLRYILSVSKNMNY